MKNATNRKNKVGLNVIAIAVLCVASCVVVKHQSQSPAQSCFDKIRKEVDAAKLQGWATNLLNQHPIGQTNYFGLFEAPNFMNKVCENRKPSVYIQGGFYGEQSYVRLFWGSGTMGHWGLKVAPPGFFPRNSNDTNTEWTPGVYFFENYR